MPWLVMLKFSNVTSCFGCYSADFRYFRSLCRRSRLLSCADRLHIMMEGTSYMFLTGPKVVKTVTGEDVSQENLGGASVHSTKSGVAHFAAETEEEVCIIRKLFSYIPQNNLEEAPY